MTLAAFRWLLQHKAQAGIAALVLDAGKPPPSALETHAAGLAYADPIECLIGPTGKRLRQRVGIGPQKQMHMLIAYHLSMKNASSPLLSTSKEWRSYPASNDRG